MNKLQKFDLPVRTDGLEPSTAINLVLSGGGVKGVAHVALIEKLEEMGITISAISGCSAGAIVGALYASGMRPQEILQFFKETTLFRYTWLNPLKPGIFDSDRYALIFRDYVEVDFESLKVPLHIAATNMQENKVVYFSSGSLLRPLLASCAIPGVFSPVEINGALHSDGGVMDNFPIYPFMDSDIPTLGSYISKPTPKTKEQLNSTFKLTYHSNSLLFYAANQYKFKQIDKTIDFPLDEFNSLDTHKADQIYQKAKAHLSQMVKA